MSRKAPVFVSIETFQVKEAYNHTRGVYQAARQSSTFMKSEVNKLLKANEKLNQLDSVKVVSHVQRESGDWYLNTLMLQDYDVPFKYKRKKKYRDLKGASVNLTYYPQIEQVAGMDFEYMKVVRIRRS